MGVFAYTNEIMISLPEMALERLLQSTFILVFGVARIELSWMSVGRAM